MASSLSRKVLTLILIAAAGILAILGRLGLDWLIRVAPQWASEIDRFGGWVLGMTIGLAVVLPIFRMYGVFDRDEDGDKS